MVMVVVMVVIMVIMIMVVVIVMAVVMGIVMVIIPMILVIVVIGIHFMKYMEAFKPMLILALRNTDEYQVSFALYSA